MRKLTICGTDIARFAIVTKTTPDPAEKTAAEFLVRVIEGSCGVKLPISTTAENGICIGTREPSPEVKWDGFRITTDDKNLYLDGNIPRGTLYAAYDFAEKYIGYRYFFDDCEVIPTEGEAVIQAGTEKVENPVFAARRTTCWQHRRSAELCVHSRLNDCVPVTEAHGGVEPANSMCHSFGRLCPSGEYFEKHPEYYALHEGKRVPCESGWGPGQLCLTNPDVLRIVTENVLKELREHPETKVVEVSQADNQRYCQCERCAAVDEEEGSHAGTMIRFVNAVAEAVEKAFPHVLVRTFAYQYTRKAPKITKARHNVLVRYCTIEACFRHALDDPNCQTNASVFRKELNEWGKMADQISIWDYICNWSCFAAPFPNLYTLRENARFFAENNAIHVLAECNDGYSGGLYPEMRAYLMAKLLWNPYMSKEEYEEHITDFLSHFYGKGWREIRRVIDLELETTAHRCIGCFDDVDVGSVYYMSEPQVEGINAFVKENFVPKPYQPTLNDHYLVGFVRHLDEIKACYDRAFALAETEAERHHLEISRYSISYVDLFVKSRKKGTMTEEERRSYEAEVEQLYKDKEHLGCRYNISTANGQYR